jgi:hypothetical protein
MKKYNKYLSEFSKEDMQIIQKSDLFTEKIKEKNE